MKIRATQESAGCFLPQTAGGTKRLLLNCMVLVLTLGQASDLRAVFLQSTSNPRLEFLRANLDVFPGTEELFEPDPRLFWRLKPNLKNVQAAERLPPSEYRFSVSTDASGRRLDSQPKRAQYKVLFLGDSCTFGIPVNDDETFPALVQKGTQGVESINAGVPGYSAFQGRLLLEGMDSSFRPNVVVITFWPNDRSVWDHLGDAEHQDLIAAERSGEFSRYRILRLLRKATPGKRERLTETEFAEQIRLMIRACRHRGSEPVLQVWPTQRQMTAVLEIDYQQVLRRIASEDRVRIVDLVPVFRSRRDAVLFVDNIHATKAGYAVVAETFLPILREILNHQDTKTPENNQILVSWCLASGQDFQVKQQGC